MNLTIDQKILNDFSTLDLKVYFYQAGCEGTKIRFSDSFEKTGLESMTVGGKNIYFEPKDKAYLENGKILLKTSDTGGHASDEKYIFLSEHIKSRCGCATSFSFEHKLINSHQLKILKKAFKK